MIIELLTPLAILAALIIPGLIIMATFSDKGKLNKSINLWRTPWLGLSYLIVLSINLNIAKIGLYKGGYGLDWFKGVYVLIFLLVIMVIWLLIFSNSLIKISSLIKRDGWKILTTVLIFIFFSLFISRFGSFTIDQATIFNLSTKLLLNSKEVFIVSDSKINFGSSVIYSLFADGFKIYHPQLDTSLSVIVYLLLAFLIKKFIFFRQIPIRIVLLMSVLIIWLGLKQQTSAGLQLSIGGVMAWGIAIQTMIIFTQFWKNSVLNKNGKSSAFNNENILIGISLSAIILLDSLLAKILILIYLFLAIYYLYKYKSPIIIFDYLKSLFFCFVFSPLFFGLSILR